MKQLNRIYIMFAICTGLLTTLSFSQTKWAQTGFNFLSVSPDARASALGDAVNSFSGFSGALYYNPSSMAEMPTLINAAFGINNWIAGIKYLSANVEISPFTGDYGVIGFSFQSVDYGDVEGTMIANNSNGYVDTKIFTPTAMAFGIGYAKMLNDKFSIGAQIRFAHQSLGESVVPDGNSTRVKDNKADAIAYDFGTIYKTGVESLVFGMSVRNFSKEIKYEEESFQLPLLFTIGISANLFDFVDIPGPEQALVLSFDSDHPRSHPERIKVGLEYQFMKILSLRGGYISANSEDDFTFGFGVSSFGFELDYAYTPFGVFDNVQRFTARFSL